MRPNILFPLFKPVTTLNGVGPRIGNLLEKLTGIRLINLLWHLPTGIIDRRYAPKVAEVRAGAVATITIRVLQHKRPSNKRLPYKVICSDNTGEMSLVFFRANEKYLLKVLPEGETRVVSGRVDVFGVEVQMSHPDHIGTLDELEKIKNVEPVYPLTSGLTLRVLRRAISNALQVVPEIAEWADDTFILHQGWKSWKQSLLAAHAPKSKEELSFNSLARARLAYDELFANQIALALIRRQMRKARGRPIRGTGILRARIAHVVPFKMTNSQLQAINEINNDLMSNTRMLRLLQGDVGSGKTIVALMAMLIAVESRFQAVMMAPTELLARQHLATITPLVKAAGLRVVFLSGRERGKARTNVLAALKSGAAQLAIGTHALFQDDVEYNDLALAVIDEQHRFGVHQRLTLASKGTAVDVLVMTATPIPRTLMLTAYGDMDVSRLTEKPPGRRPIQTRAIPLDRLNDVVSAVRRALQNGNKVFWVCPLVEESETLDIGAVEDRHKFLTQIFGKRVGLVHGRLSGREKDKVMASFAGKTIDILVATTVIEVGVDIPDANIMVIEHAERYGLAQLHQLRGRIGRGGKSSTCLMLYNAKLTDAARARLEVMRETDDGFIIAEKDLKFRGAGELLGTRQSGMPEFVIADVHSHSELLVRARDEAHLVLTRDPELESDRGKSIRILLYLFERDSVVRYLESG